MISSHASTERTGSPLFNGPALLESYQVTFIISSFNCHSNTYLSLLLSPALTLSLLSLSALSIVSYCASSCLSLAQSGFLFRLVLAVTLSYSQSSLTTFSVFVLSCSLFALSTSSASMFCSLILHLSPRTLYSCFSYTVYACSRFL